MSEDWRKAAAVALVVVVCLLGAYLLFTDSGPSFDVEPVPVEESQP